MSYGHGGADAACSRASAVACLVGQVRSFAETSIKYDAKLLDALGSSESIVHVDLQDSGNGGRHSHSVSELTPILKTVRASSWRLYNSSDWMPAYKDARSNCWSDRPGHWSHHEIQFFNMRKCLEHVLEREAACSHQYQLIARGRTDMLLDERALRAVKRIAAGQRAKPSEAAMYMATGVGGDRFFLLTRAALPVLVRGLARAFTRDECGVPDANHYHPERGRCLGLGRVPSNGTECLLITILTRGGVHVHFEPELAVPHVDIVRTVLPPPVANDTTASPPPPPPPASVLSSIFGGRRRRLAAVARSTTTTFSSSRGPSRSTHALLKKRTTNATLAITICGQSRTLPSIVQNIHFALKALRNESDLFLATDIGSLVGIPYLVGTKVLATKHIEALSKEQKDKILEAIVAKLKPTAFSVVNKSAGQDESLMRCRNLMRQSETSRGFGYQWVLRLRPDMAYSRPFPSLDAWPKPTEPTLFSDYLTSGLNGTRCGATRSIPVGMLRTHGACVDDTIGFMSRSAASYYLGHWFWHEKCGGTVKLPVRKRSSDDDGHEGIITTHPVGEDGRLGCIECRLGCSMHFRNVRVAALPALATHRVLVRKGSLAKHQADGLLGMGQSMFGPSPPPIEMQAMAYSRENGISIQWSAPPPPIESRMLHLLRSPTPHTHTPKQAFITKQELIGLIVVGVLLGVLFVLVMNWMDRVAQRGDC